MRGSGVRIPLAAPFSSSAVIIAEGEEGMAGGHSSVGRALEWHSRGRRFDSAWLHHPAKRENGACGCSSGVEHNLAKVGVEGSNPFARSNSFERGNPSKRRPLGRLSCLGLKQTGPLHAGAGPAVTRGHTSLTFHPGKPVGNSRLSGRRCLQRSMSRRGGGLQPRRNRYASLHPVMPGRVPGLSIFCGSGFGKEPARACGRSALVDGPCSRREIVVRHE